MTEEAEPDLAGTRYAYDLDAIDGSDVARFGGKGAGLARMAAAGISVPPAFVVTTDACAAFIANGNRLPGSVRAEIAAGVERLEARTGRRFDSREGVPLLLSVRSGAPVSMPGMMDTVLNVGLDAASAARLAKATGNPRFATDTWLRFWRAFGDLVLGIDADAFAGDAVTSAAQMCAGDGSREAFEDLGHAIRDILRREGVAGAADPDGQLHAAVEAVFKSWNSPRARAYREHHGIGDHMGTAVTVQAMVFGNLDDQSGSGVAFSRNPNTGESGLFGEYLAGRQGEELVSGEATPVAVSDRDSLPPGTFERLSAWAALLEALYEDAVDIEFTIESSTLYLLQVRTAKRTAAAAFRIAVDLVAEGRVEPRRALGRVSTDQLNHLLRPSFDPDAVAAAVVLTTGIGSSPGHASGRAVLDADRAAAQARDDDPVILVRPTTSPLDIRGMLAADGVVTARGGALSHAAVVSRAMDKPCVVGCERLEVDSDGRSMRVGDLTLPEGTVISIDGTEGTVYVGAIARRASAGAMSGVEQLLDLADASSGCAVWSTPRGIGTVTARFPAGWGPVPVTDLLIADGRIDALVAAIDELNQDAGHGGVEEALVELARDSSADLIAQADGRPVDVRLPNLGSPRAQRMMSRWIGLAPELLLPAGVRAFYRPLLRGIAMAAQSVDHDGVTAIVGGVTDPAELQAIRECASGFGTIGVGGALQSLGALAAGVEMVRQGFPVWVDIGEIVRTYFGFPSALALAGVTFDNYVMQGTMAVNPTRQLDAALEEAIGRFVIKVSDVTHARVGADCGAGIPARVVEQLHGAGFRTFAASGHLAAALRLQLGQQPVDVTAHKEGDDD
jgi:pyruvate,orthophosphate dikinase